MSKKATEDALSSLHNKLAEVLSEALSSEEVTPAMLNVARQFLKDNGIDSVLEPGNPLDTLAEAELPFKDNVRSIEKRLKKEATH